MQKKASIHVRLPGPLRAALEARAKREDEYPAHIVREALQTYLFPKPTFKLPAKGEGE